MWNGFWKLTVMVGVIGIGLFAVFQAQKGMNRIADLGSPEASADGESEPLPNGDALSVPTNEPPLNVSFDRDRPLDRNRQGKPTVDARSNSNGDRIDLVGNFSADQPPSIQTAGGPTTSVPNRLAVDKVQRRQPGLSFNDEPHAEDLDDPALQTHNQEPSPFADEDFADEATEKTARRTVQQASESSISAPSGEPESTEDPFSSDLAAPAVEAPASDESNPADDLEPKPKKATKTTPDLDFGDASAIPRSKRGIEKSERRVESSPPEATVESESNPFDDQPKPMDAPPALDPDSLGDEPLPALDAPPATGETEPSEAEVDQPAASPAKPDDLPADAPNRKDEFLEEEPPRSIRSRAIPTLPKDLDEEPDEANHLRSSPRPGKSRSVPEVAEPTDMTGDGVAGDVSQRGLQQPRLTIEKVAQQQAVLEQPLIYTIIVRNTGNVAAHHVVIEDRIPKGTELLGTSPRAELVGKNLIWKEAVLKPNEEKKISIKVIPKQEGPIGSVARVHFATEVSAEIQVSAPQLEFTVNAPKEVRIGQNFDLVFQLKNIGKVDASNILVRDLVPDHLKQESGNDIECPIGKLAPNEVREIVLPVLAVKTGSCVNRAVLTADSGIKDQLDSKIEIVGEQLALTRTGQSRIYVERPAVFTNTIRNEGNKQVSKVRISEVVPAGMEFESASDAGKYDANLNSVIWSLGPLAPGDERALSVKYVPKETGTLAGSITATGATGSTAAIQSTVEVVGRPELQMETLSSTGLVTVGDKITSKIQLKNSGTAAARNVQLKIQLPPELRLVNARGAKFQKDKNRVVFDLIDELAPRSNATFELTLEPIEEADARVVIEVSAEHLAKPHRREESIQIARDALISR